MRQLIAFVLFLLFTSGALGQEIGLGRLFFSPEQRAKLDQQRLRGIAPSSLPGNDGPVTLNGLVTRSSGRSTAWLNGVPVEERNLEGDSLLRLRPGETTAPSRRDAPIDILHGGQIQVHRDGR